MDEGESLSSEQRLRESISFFKEQFDNFSWKSGHRFQLGGERLAELALSENELRGTFHLMKSSRGECIDHLSLANYFQKEHIQASPQQIQEMIEICSKQAEGRICIEDYLSLLSGLTPSLLDPFRGRREPIVSICITEVKDQPPALVGSEQVSPWQSDSRPHRCQQELTLLKNCCRKFYEVHLNLETVVIMVEILAGLEQQDVTKEQLTKLIRKKLPLKFQDLDRFLNQFMLGGRLVNVQELGVSLIGVTVLSSASKIRLAMAFFPAGKITLSSLIELVNGLMFSRQRSLQARLRRIVQELRLPAEELTNQHIITMFQQFALNLNPE